MNVPHHQTQVGCDQLAFTPVGQSPFTNYHVAPGSYPAVSEQDRRNLMGVGGLSGGIGNLPFSVMSARVCPFMDGWQQISVNKTD